MKSNNDYERLHEFIRDNERLDETNRGIFDGNYTMA